MTGPPTPPSQDEKPPPRKRRRRILVVTISVLLVIVSTPFALRALFTWEFENRRAEWKASGLQRLASLSLTNEVVLREVDEIHRELNEVAVGSARNVNLGWAKEHVLGMTNGEFVVYQYFHGSNTGKPLHLFIGRASDGRWLYSAYHFCNQMASLPRDEPPGSINEFAKQYAVREFDGKSDECLKKTWPLNK